ncbi:hypothetical protein H0H87_012492 [Tephrocybe sp. NHM501043]|nr:hypothetical protein H0H87_012492 [Tephrocybe sp. NHM501043]
MRLGVLLWSMRDYRAARSITKKYKESHNWTLTHGHFIWMGGFMLYEDGKPKQTLSENKFYEMLQTGEIDFPSITEAEIMDRSKGDALSKGFALVQTVWFIAQCVARGPQHLALTELEVTTLALAAINAMMYFCWWDKPLNVLHPVAIHLKQPILVREGLEPMDNPSSEPLLLATSPPLNKPITSSDKNIRDDEDTSPTHPFLPTPHEPSSDNGQYPLNIGPRVKPRTSEGFMRWTRRLHAPFSYLTECFAAPFRSIRDAVVDNLHGRGRWNMIWHISFMWPIGYPMAELTGTSGTAKDKGLRLRVPIFGWNTGTRTDGSLWILSAISGGCFASIHYIAWSFDFPSKAEQILWRAATIIMVICTSGLPVLFFVVILINEVVGQYMEPLIREWKSMSSKFSQRMPEWFGVIESVLIIGLGLTPLVAYVFARIVLLILSIVTLRRLPPSAYETIEWSNFIPHI